MKGRREFLKSIAGFGAAMTVGTANVSQSGAPAANQLHPRGYWLEVMQKIATPVLENLARRELRKKMPVEAANPSERVKYTHLKTFGRLLSGIAPWRAAQDLDEAESKQQQRLVNLTRESLDAATNPNSPDFMNFRDGNQPLVDAAFMAQGILRGWSMLWQGVDARV